MQQSGAKSPSKDQEHRLPRRQGLNRTASTNLQTRNYKPPPQNVNTRQDHLGPWRSRCPWPPASAASRRLPRS
eukprot:6208926-Pleurochrysis_carterae.AAC.3